MGHRLPPGVERGDNADLGTEPFGVGRHRLQRLGGEAHQQGIDDGLVVEGDLGDGGRKREDDMEVGNRQEVGDTGGDPFRPSRALALGAMAVAAGIVSDAGRAAAVTCFNVAAEPGRAAGFDRAHDTAFASAEMAGVVAGVD